MKSEEIKRLVAKSENAAVEFKRARGGVPADFWPSYSSFANTDGGVIILGVREKDGKREIEGLVDTETFSRLFVSVSVPAWGFQASTALGEKERFAAPSIVESYEPDRTKVMVEFESDDSELGEMIGKVPEVIGKASEVGVIGPELGEKTSEVGEKKAVSEGENAEVTMKTVISDDENVEVTMKKAISDDVNRISDDEKQRSEGEKGEFDILMGAYRNDFRENARKVLAAFAEDPEVDIPSVAKRLGFSAISVWRAIRVIVMKEVGLLVREGGDKGGRWIVKKAEVPK